MTDTQYDAIVDAHERFTDEEWSAATEQAIQLAFARKQEGVHESLILLTLLTEAVAQRNGLAASIMKHVQYSDERRCWCRNRAWIKGVRQHDQDCSSTRAALARCEGE